MPKIIIPHRWTRQPPGPVEIDWSNPLTRGLRFAISNGVEWVSKSIGSQSGAAKTVRSGGTGPQLTTTTGAITFDTGVASGMLNEICLLQYGVIDSIAADATSVSKCATNGATATPFDYGITGPSGALKIGRANTGYRVWRSAATITAGKDFVGVVNQSANIASTPGFYINGVFDTGTATSIYGGSGSGAATEGGTLKALNRGDAVPYWNGGTVYLTCGWARALSNDEIRSVSDNPWQIFKPINRKIFFGVGGSGPTYTLTAAPGSFSLTGIASSLSAARILTANTASFTLTGQATSLKYNRVLAAEVGSFTMDGKNANLLFNRILTATTGGFTLTGNAANLVYTPFGVTYTLTAETGSFNLTGQLASLIANRVLTAQLGEFTLTGNDAGLYLVVPGTGPVLYLDLISKKVMLLQRLD